MTVSVACAVSSPNRRCPSLWALVLVLGVMGTAWGQNPAAAASDGESNSGKMPLTSMWEHSQTSPFWISGQVNVILQGHPAFDSPYSGPNSLRPAGEARTSFVSTLYLGWQVSGRTELFLDFESAGGHGIGDALGLAGFTNLDVVRNPTLGISPYLARAMVRRIVALSDETVDSARTQLSLATKLPVRRLVFQAGKFGAADFFDVNSIGSDSHLQFMNWTVDNNGAYDYAADTRGYTFGAMVEFQDRNWGLRFGELLMPKVANGSRLQWDLSRSHAENVEFEFRHSSAAKRPGGLRLLAFVNHANMGVYRRAVGDFLAGRQPVPDITAHPPQSTVKYGFGMNGEQALTARLRAFLRLGWNEGQHESFAYTEADSAVLGGIDYRGDAWRRKQDRVGLAFSGNGLSKDHALYLKLGGQGFILGDGHLNYGREQIVEAYYNLHVWRGLFIAADLQHVNNPGYNRDRGPVVVPGARVHLEF